MSTDDEDAIVQEKDEERPELEIIDTTKNDLSDFGTKVTRRSSRLSVQTGKTKRMDISVRRDISVADLKRLVRSSLSLIRKVFQPLITFVEDSRSRRNGTFQAIIKS
jgi:tRNA uridine 5-carbamoylmethylation protein Kti12